VYASWSSGRPKAAAALLFGDAIRVDIKPLWEIDQATAKFDAESAGGGN
jgi:hypothetical protein